jgi:hypothetical protein
VQLRIPVNPGRDPVLTALSFALIGIPFVFAGIVICIALTRFPGHTGGLYAADLAGSAAGCVLTIPILNNIHAPSAVILNAGMRCSRGGLRLASAGRLRITGSGDAVRLCMGQYVFQARRYPMD